MNIALISGNFLSKKGGISTTLKNFYEKLTDLGETIHLIDNSSSDIQGLNIIHSREKFKNFFFQNLGFYLFLFYLFFRILIIQNIKFREKLKVSFYYCFYPKDLVNRIKSIKKLIVYFQKVKVDIVFCISSSFPLFYGFILSKFFNKPLVTLAHGEDFIKRYPYSLNTIIFRHIEKIIVSNIIMKRLFLKIHNVREDKIKIIFRGINLEKISIDSSKIELREKLNISKNDFIIMTVSRIHPRKGIENVINVIKQIKEENTNLPIKYYIIGTGKELIRLKKKISESRLTDTIKFLGEINDITRNQYYKLSDLFILVPEIQKNTIEGFGIVYLEANYFKLPVIGTRSGGVKIAIEDGKTGFLIDPKDEKGLKEKILMLYYNKDLREKLGENGYKRVLKFFDWKNKAIEYRDVLKNTIKDKSTSIS